MPRAMPRVLLIGASSSAARDRGELGGRVLAQKLQPPSGVYITPIAVGFLNIDDYRCCFMMILCDILYI